MTPATSTLIEALKAIRAAHPTLLGEFEQQGVVFERHEIRHDRWAAIAFKLYNRISELSVQAQIALSEYEDARKVGDPTP